MAYFNKAWDTASQYGFLQGSFSAIMNLASLHASLLERDPARLGNPSAAIEALLKRIGNYRESYERDTLKLRMDKLQADAEKQKREATQKEKDELRDQVAEQARDIYYRSDIAMGVLIYYLAELKSRDMGLPVESATGGAFGIYRNHMDIFSLYRQALEKFLTAYRIARAEKKDELSIKLLMTSEPVSPESGRLMTLMWPSSTPGIWPISPAHSRSSSALQWPWECSSGKRGFRWRERTTWGWPSPV
jgi:hypothetical protein